MSRKFLFQTVLPIVTAVLVAMIVGAHVEPFWLKCAIGMPAGLGAFFVYRSWGNAIT